MYNKIFKSIFIISALMTLISCSSKKEETEKRFITVYGKGTSELTADNISLTFKIEAFDRFSETAYNSCEENTKNVILALKEIGVNLDDISLKEIIISQGTNRFSAEREITVLIRNSQNAPKVIDQATGPSKASELITWRLICNDESNLIKEAELSAINDAYNQANAIATASNAKLGKVLTINSYNNRDSLGLGQGLRELKTTYQDEYKKQTVVIQVNVTYELTD